MTSAVDRLFGCGDLHRVFRGVPRVTCPWPRLGPTKTRPSPTSMVTRQFVGGDVHLTLVDPRLLFCSQSWVLLEHAAYYLTGRWERTGITSADRHRLANRYPIVVRDDRDRLVIAAGHHRSLAALIEGRPVLCRMLPDAGDDAVAVLPHLVVGPRTHLPAVACTCAEEAVRAIERGRIARVADHAQAQQVIAALTS